MLRILMATNTRWTRNLGAAKVPLELSEALRDAGHEVEKFSFEDAFPSLPPTPNGLAGVMRRYLDFYRTTHLFSRRLRAHIRRNADRYDVLDVVHPDLPYSKRDLGFAWLVVSRSVALVPAYADFAHFANGRWRRRRSLRELGHDLLALPAHRKRSRDVLPSFRHADLVNVSSRDDARLVEEMGMGEKVVYFPFGLSADRRRRLAAAAADPAARLASATIVFIGAWTHRKGAADWPAIAGAVLRAAPRARFLMLGTGFSAAHVLAGFPAEFRESVDVVPGYDSEELPALLSNATVGVFPSYLEGFGFAVLEMLAAGLPTLAYDAPGPRDLLARHRFPALTLSGDTEQLAAAVLTRLSLPVDAYASESAESLRVAALYDWDEIAGATAARYATDLSRLHR